MKNYKPIESKIWNAITALTSGVLTSIIYDALSHTSYMLEIDDKKYAITSTSLSFFASLGLVCGTFLMIWTVISLIIPCALKVHKRFSYDKVTRPNASELLKTITSVTETVKALYPHFEPTGVISDSPDYAKLYARELINAVTLLHKKFIPHNKKFQREILSFFRKPQFSSIISINSRLSTYEFNSLISILKLMVTNLQEYGNPDELLKKDCNEMLENLSELESILQ